MLKRLLKPGPTVTIALLALASGAMGSLWLRSDGTKAELTASSFCVDGAAEGDRLELVKTLKRAEPLALAQANSLPAEVSGKQNPLAIAPQCPEGFKVPEEAVGDRALPADWVKSEPVLEASPYNVKVFVVDDDAAVLRGAEFRRLPYERTCEPEGHPCAEVSTAIYVPKSAIHDIDFARRIILEGLGLRAAIEYPSGHMP